MNLSPRLSANESFTVFCEKDGNEYIASVFAIEKLLEQIKKSNPKTIIELGVGIGTLPYAVNAFLGEKAKEVTYYGTEDNEFCRTQIDLNLPQIALTFQLFRSFNEINSNVEADLIIIDGKFDNMALLKKYASRHAVFFIEGDRNAQVLQITQAFPNAMAVRCISNFRNREGTPFQVGFWVGGCTLVYSNPTLGQRLEWLQNKIQSKIKYWQRNFNV